MLFIDGHVTRHMCGSGVIPSGSSSVAIAAKLDGVEVPAVTVTPNILPSDAGVSILSVTGASATGFTVTSWSNTSRPLPFSWSVGLNHYGRWLLTGQTSITVTHGLGYAPPFCQIGIYEHDARNQFGLMTIPALGGGYHSAIGYAVTATSSTTFTITASAAPARGRNILFGITPLVRIDAATVGASPTLRTITNGNSSTTFSITGEFTTAELRLLPLDDIPSGTTSITDATASGGSTSVTVTRSGTSGDWRFMIGQAGRMQPPMEAYGAWMNGNWPI